MTQKKLKYGKAITVYGASASGLDEVFHAAARGVALAAVRHGSAVITGGGTQGMMGTVNDTVLASGGTAIGIIPQFMVDRGWGHRHLTAVEVTASMHTRKAMMAELSAGVIALPGGVGTLDELMEIITWRQLGLYTGNVVILNVDGYWDDLLSMLATAERRGFMRKTHDDARLWHVTSNPEEAVRLALAISVDGSGKDIFG